MILTGLLLLVSTSRAEPPQDPSDRPFTLSWEAALGAQWVAWVGDESAIARLDPIPTESVRIVQSALGIEITGPLNSYAALRVEEGLVHAGGLESAEALVGIQSSNRVFGAWVGRNDLEVSRDRDYEPEQLIHSVRPVLSRVTLPIHAGAAAVSAAWPERASLEAGVAYPSLTADAPYVRARVRLHPLGTMPEAQDGYAEGVRFQLGGAALWHPSPSLGTSLWTDADAELRWRWWMLSAGWIRFDGPQLSQELLAELGGRLFGVRRADLYAYGRVERATGLEDGEDARWLGAGRLCWRAAEGRVRVYTELTMSREQGTAPADGDVVVLDPSIERRNGTAALGLQLHW
ncbi:MAG: hypothetical protein H6739_26870 [Alphaproteobacteria bacterium]|nr:hypothetical protein [Alphaproteobacteria bacterium]